MPKLLDSLSRVAFNLLCLGIETLVQKLGSLRQFTIDLPLIRLPKRVIQLLSQQGLGNLRFFNGLLHLIEKIVKSFPLLPDLIFNLLTIILSPQPSARWLFLQFIQLLGEFILFLLQLLCVISHLPHRFIELSSRTLPELIPHFLEFPLSTSP